MKVKTYSYVVKVTDEDGKHVPHNDVPYDVFKEMCENLGDEIWEGDIDYEDDSDEWIDINKGEERFEARNNK